MRSILTKICIPAVLAGLMAASFAAPASADGRYKDKVYADSFGNLVIYSAAGYKRIVVGEGHLAKELSAYSGNRGPEVVYLDKRDGRYYGRHCPSVLLKGRSYMYGLPDNVLPEPALDNCR